MGQNTSTGAGFGSSGARTGGGGRVGEIGVHSVAFSFPLLAFAL